MDLDLAGKKLYEVLAPRLASNMEPKKWEDLTEDQKNATREMVLIVVNNFPAPIDGEVRIRLTGMHGTEPIKHIFRCDSTEVAITEQCAKLKDWLMELTRGFRTSENKEWTEIKEDAWTEGLRTFDGREQLLEHAYKYLQVQVRKSEIPKVNWKRINDLLGLVKNVPSHASSLGRVAREIERICKLSKPEP